MSDEIDDDEVEVISTYDMSEDAMGLGDFIVATFKDIPDSLICVDVSDEQHRPAKSARFERDDFGIHLIIEFDYGRRGPAATTGTNGSSAATSDKCCAKSSGFASTSMLYRRN